MKAPLRIIKWIILAALAVRVLLESVPVLILNGVIFIKGDYDDAMGRYLLESTIFELGIALLLGLIWFFLFRYRL